MKEWQSTLSGSVGSSKDISQVFSLLMRNLPGLEPGSPTKMPSLHHTLNVYVIGGLLGGYVNCILHTAWLCLPQEPLQRDLVCRVSMQGNNACFLLFYIIQLGVYGKSKGHRCKGHAGWGWKGAGSIRKWNGNQAELYLWGSFKKFLFYSILSYFISGLERAFFFIKINSYIF